MAAIFRVMAFVLVVSIFGCNHKSGSSAATAIVDTPRSFVRNYGVNDNGKLIAFIGEKISVEPLPHKERSMDNGFKAKYAILKMIYGDFREDTIEFIAYDHYGTPAFSKFKHVLLYVMADSGIYCHEKYMYNDLYKTKDGRWAGTYASDDYEHIFNKRTKIKPVKIDFAERVAYSRILVNQNGTAMKVEYIEPYFRNEADSAVAVYGNYADELFELKKNGYLTYRELFEWTAEQEEDLVESNQPELSTTPRGKDDLKFEAFWKKFVTAITDPTLKDFKDFALDSLAVGDTILPTASFVNKCAGEIIDAELLKRIVDKTKLAYSSSVIYPKLAVANIKTKMEVGKTYRGWDMDVTRSPRHNNPSTISFYFIDTNEGCRLYQINFFGYKKCCR